jgi:CheY-like chemotaxis protein
MANDKKRILVAEDEDVLRQIYEEELKREGYEVFTARNGKEALVHLEADKPDLIILDIAMPEMSGMEAIGPILNKNRKIPIILNTAYPQYQEDLMSWGADAYVVKSGDLTDLKNKIRELLGKSDPSWL